MDVTALYTNIPHKEGIESCRSFLEHCNTHPAHIDDICNLIHFILTHNNFRFNGEHFLQTSGTAMGCKFAPAYAIIFMHILEQKILQNYPLKPYCYWRYIDDIFMIWTHGVEALVQFHTYMNAQHPDIKFSMDYSATSIPFLDVQINIQDQHVVTSLYTKPTDEHNYLDFRSCHPRKLKESIVYSQFLRLKRICSDSNDCREHIVTMAKHFIENNYPLITVKRAMEKVSKVNRLALLRYKTDKKQERIPLVLPYNTNTNKLFQLLRKDFSLFKQDPLTSRIFGEPPIHAQKQQPNLKRILSSPLSTTDSRDLGGNVKCDDARCKICKIINTNHTVTLPNSTVKIRPPKLSCGSPNVVYAIYCATCELGNYIGETCNEFRRRLNNHRSTTRKQGLKTQPVPEHFSSVAHTVDDMRVVLLQSGFKSTAERRLCELKWIFKLNTKNIGLNRDVGFMEPYSFYKNETTPHSILQYPTNS